MKIKTGTPQEVTYRRFTWSLQSGPTFLSRLFSSQSNVRN